MKDEKKFLILIGGPTASGKSDMAIHLAKQYNCDVISADSRQFYKEMQIGTNRMEEKDWQGVMHHFINFQSVSDAYNVGKFETAVIEFLNDYYRTKNIAIVCGGSGLYLNAIINGLDEFPDVNKSILETLEEELTKSGIETLQLELQEKDPDYYSTIDIQNPRRIIRALSVIRGTNKKFSSFLNQQKVQRNFTSIPIALSMPREALYHKINNRVDQMIEKGLLEEVKSLFKHRTLPALETVGYKEIFSYLEGAMEFSKSIEEIKKNTRRYAKRQMTWFRNQGSWVEFNWNDTDGINKHINKIINL